MCFPQYSLHFANFNSIWYNQNSRKTNNLQSHIKTSVDLLRKKNNLLFKMLTFIYLIENFFQLRQSWIAKICLHRFLNFDLIPLKCEITKLESRWSGIVKFVPGWSVELPNLELLLSRKAKVWPRWSGNWVAPVKTAKFGSLWSGFAKYVSRLGFL